MGAVPSYGPPTLTACCTPGHLSKKTSPPKNLWKCCTKSRAKPQFCTLPSTCRVTTTLLQQEGASVPALCPTHAHRDWDMEQSSAAQRKRCSQIKIAQFTPPPPTQPSKPPRTPTADLELRCTALSSCHWLVTQLTISGTHAKIKSKSKITQETQSYATQIYICLKSRKRSITWSCCWACFPDAFCSLAVVMLTYLCPPQWQTGLECMYVCVCESASWSVCAQTYTHTHSGGMSN